MSVAHAPGAAWPGGAPGAFAMTVDVDGRIPHVFKTGGETRMAELEQRDFGPRRGIWRLLDVFAAAGVTVSFYVPGAYAERHPDVVRAIAGEGHEIGLHGWMHEPPAAIDRETFREVTARARDLLAALSGADIVGYRSPSWDMTDDAFDVIRELGVRYDSSMMGDDRPYAVNGMTEIPVSWTLDDAPFFRYVGGAHPGHPPRRPADMAAFWCDEISAAARWGTLAVLTVHDWMTGRPAPAAALETVLAHAKREGVWIAPAREIAAWYEERSR